MKINFIYCGETLSITTNVKKFVNRFGNNIYLDETFDRDLPSYQVKLILKYHVRVYQK